MFDESLLEKELYQIAFTHRSFLNESNKTHDSNERLEFLGDSILSFIISQHLFNLRKTDNEGDLTNLRSYIVKTTSLAKAASKLNLGRYLSLSKGEEMSGGRENPQLLANTYEAFLGALFLDQGIEKAQQFVKETLIILFDHEIKNGPPKDAKSELQELLQERYKRSPLYRIVRTEGPDHARTFTVGVFIQGKQIGTGQGLSKQVAEEAAAAKALSEISSGLEDITPTSML